MRRGDLVGSLRIERLLGVGGMGEVYLAFDVRLERQVAVKLLTNSDARERMLREARAVSGLRHPGIVTVYDIGEHQGRTFIAMEYVEGQTFSAMMARRGRLPPAEAVALIAQVGDTLASAHDAGILHRDVKSANLMVDADGRVRVLDFGLCKRNRRTDDAATAGSPAPAPDPAPLDPPTSPPPSMRRSSRRRGFRTSADPPDRERSLAAPREAVAESNAVLPPNATAAGAKQAESTPDEPETRAGTRLGTPGWAPPELMTGQPAEVRSDVFSLGVVLYHLLTGRLPFPGQSWKKLSEEIARGPTPPSVLAPSIPPALDAVILSALAIELDKRPANVRELVARAQAAIVKGRRRRARWGRAAGAITAGIGVIAVAAAAWAPREASRVPAQGPAAAGAPVAFLPPERLTALGGCAYSPAFVDRDTVTFDLTRDGAVDLYRIDLGARAPVQLTSDPGWEWRSGPGRHSGEAAFLHQGSDGTAIETIDLASGQRAVLLPTAWEFALTADTLYYATNGQLRRRHGQRDEIMLALPDQDEIHSITAAPDGSRLAMTAGSVDGSTKLCIVATSTARMVCPVAPSGSGRPAFSPDASAVYFEQRDGIGRLRLTDEVREVAVPGVAARGGIAVSPDGRAVVWSDCSMTSELIDVTGEDPRPAGNAVGPPTLRDPASPVAPSAGPDADKSRLAVGDRQVQMKSAAIGPGGQFAYVRRRADTHQIVVREPDRTEREVVSRAGVQIADVAFSPDGTSIAFVIESGLESGIYLMPINEGAQANRLTDDAGDSKPVFVVDSELVFTRYGRDRVPHLMRIRTDGSNERAASSRPRRVIGSDWVAHRVLLISPDLDWLYWWDPVTGRESPGPEAAIMKSRRDKMDLSMSWDGRWLLYILGNNGQNIWRQRLDGTSQPELLRNLPDDITVVRGVIDPSGHAQIMANRWTGDLWISRRR